MPITRQGMNPVAGWYGFLDDTYKKCSFGLHPSEDGVQGGAVTSRNCAQLLPRIASATRWAPAAEAIRWDALRPVLFFLKGKTGSIGACVNKSEQLQFMLLDRDVRISDPANAVFLDIYRLDAPNFGRPMRVAAGWWTFSILDLPRFNDARLALMNNGRIGDASRCPPDSPLAKFAGGRWKADEGGVTLYGREEWRTLRYEGSGKKLISGSSMMVHDD